VFFIPLLVSGTGIGVYPDNKGDKL